nr:hypothetical protein [Tanacetum cinerariifolium]
MIQNGNGFVSVKIDTNEMIKVLPPKTAEEVVARERERKARTTLLMALLEDHLAKFHKMADAKRDGLYKGYDRFQTLLSQLKIHGAGVLQEDANQKFLRVFERDVKGTIASSSTTQNVAFVSADNTSSTNDVSTAYSVSSPTVSKSQKEGSSSYTDEINDDDMEEMDFLCQLVLIRTKWNASVSIKWRHFARDCRAKGNQDSKRRDPGYNGNKTRDNGRRPAYQDDSKALVTINGEYNTPCFWVIDTTALSAVPTSFSFWKAPVDKVPMLRGQLQTILSPKAENTEAFETDESASTPSIIFTTTTLECYVT